MRAGRYGYSLETDGRGTAEQIAALVQGLWEADARNDVRVIMTVLPTAPQLTPVGHHGRRGEK